MAARGAGGGGGAAAGQLAAPALCRCSAAVAQQLSQHSAEHMDVDKRTEAVRHGKGTASQREAAACLSRGRGETPRREGQPPGRDRTVGSSGQRTFGRPLRTDTMVEKDSEAKLRLVGATGGDAGSGGRRNARPRAHQPTAGKAVCAETDPLGETRSAAAAAAAAARCGTKLRSKHTAEASRLTGGLTMRIRRIFSRTLALVQVVKTQCGSIHGSL